MTPQHLKFYTEIVEIMAKLLVSYFGKKNSKYRYAHTNFKENNSSLSSVTWKVDSLLFKMYVFIHLKTIHILWFQYLYVQIYNLPFIWQIWLWRNLFYILVKAVLLSFRELTSFWTFVNWRSYSIVISRFSCSISSNLWYNLSVWKIINKIELNTENSVLETLLGQWDGKTASLWSHRTEYINVCPHK